MQLSSTAQQALHAVFCIAGSEDEHPLRVNEIAVVLGCPRNYLSKTLHGLVRAGVLRSARGPRGGFTLATTPTRLTLARIIAPFEPVSERRCLMGQLTCGAAKPCAAHDEWVKLASRIDTFFSKTTVATLLRRNPRALTETREAIRSIRHLNRRPSHGSVAK